MVSGHLTDHRCRGGDELAVAGRDSSITGDMRGVVAHPRPGIGGPGVPVKSRSSLGQWWSLRGLTRFEDHDRDLPALRVALEEVISGIKRDELLPEPIALLLGGDTSANIANLGADLNRGVRVGLDVVKPRGMRRLTTL